MEPDTEAGLWATELESLLRRVGQRVARIEPRRRMQAYVPVYGVAVLNLARHSNVPRTTCHSPRP